MDFEQNRFSTYVLTHGQLDVTAHGGVVNFNDISDVGSRINPNRHYIFVSKINGKYYPVKPSVIDYYQQQLLQLLKPQLDPRSGILMLGLAETATLMSIHLAELLQQQWLTDVVVFHTTRYKLKDGEFLEISESHSHAKSHHLYLNNQDLSDYKSLVLIDDEVTTGNTLQKITRVMSQQLLNIEKVIWVSYLSWIDAERRLAIKSLFPRLEIKFVQLFCGRMDYQTVCDRPVHLPQHVTSGIIAHSHQCYQLRYPTKVLDIPTPQFVDLDGVALNTNNFDNDSKYCVIGTSEFTFYPFKFAQQLELYGLDVVFQSTGRSPIAVFGPIHRREVYFDDYYNGELNLYNRSDERVAIFLFETSEQALACILAHEKNAVIGYLKRDV